MQPKPHTQHRRRRDSTRQLRRVGVRGVYWALTWSASFWSRKRVTKRYQCCCCACCWSGSLVRLFRQVNPLEYNETVLLLKRHVAFYQRPRKIVIKIFYFVSGMDRILSGCAPMSKTSMALCPDPSSIELPEGNDFIKYL